jgi:hypothetical protein
VIPHGARAADTDRGTQSSSPDSSGTGSRHDDRSTGHGRSRDEDRSPLRTRHDQPDGLPDEDTPAPPFGLLDGALGLVLGCNSGCS